MTSILEVDLAAARTDLSRGRVPDVVAQLEAVTPGTTRWVQDDIALSRLDARIDENVVLARIALDAGDNERARFHAERALTQLAELEAAVVATTRETDEGRNRTHFMSG